MGDKLIVALDVNTLQKARTLVDKLYPAIKIFKVGSELFTAAGPQAVRMINKKGAKVFLDLKFHDIPNTVASAVKQAAGLDVFMVNIHASGGSDMIKAAKEALKLLPKNKKPVLLAVTVLTSIDKATLKSLGINRPPIKQVCLLAKMAKAHGADGVVCSPQEIKQVRRACGKRFVIVTPGVRPLGKALADQKRVATPQKAIKQGADFIVVGRPITEAPNPKKAAKEIVSQISSKALRLCYSVDK